MMEKKCVALALLLSGLQHSLYPVYQSYGKPKMLETMLGRYIAVKDAGIDFKDRELEQHETFQELPNEVTHQDGFIIPNLRTSPKVGWLFFAKVILPNDDFEWFTITQNADIRMLKRTFQENVSFYTVKAGDDFLNTLNVDSLI